MIRYIILQDSKDVEIYKKFQDTNDVVVIFSIDACIICNDYKISYKWIDQIINLNEIKLFYLDIKNLNIELNIFSLFEDLNAAYPEITAFYRKYSILSKTAFLLTNYIYHY